MYFQPSLQTPGSGIPWALCWKAISVSDTTNTSPMATWVTRCLRLAWLSPLVTHLFIVYHINFRWALGTVAIYPSNRCVPSSPAPHQPGTRRMSLQQLTKKALFGSTIQRAVKTLCLKVGVETALFFCFFIMALSMFRKYQWLMVCACPQNGWLMRTPSLT